MFSRQGLVKLCMMCYAELQTLYYTNNSNEKVVFV